MPRIPLRSLIFFLSFLILSLPPALAGEGTAGDYVAGMGKNIGRGLINVVSSPAEIPCTMRDDVKEQGGSGYATGFGKGFAFMLRRILIGVSEIATFVLPAEATIDPVCHQPPKQNISA